jgi:hypothetical protein
MRQKPPAMPDMTAYCDTWCAEASKNFAPEGQRFQLFLSATKKGKAP